MMFQSKLQDKRPKSAFVSRNYSHKQYRLDDNDSLNSIRSDINKTFHYQNRSWKDVKDLTTARIDPRYAKRIDRMCVKFSIISKKQKLHQPDNYVIDVDTIAKKYVKNKSKELKKLEDTIELKKSVRNVTSRGKKKEIKPFFNISHEKLKQMQKQTKRKGGSPTKQHPYMILYESTQIEALNNLTEGNTLQFKVEHKHPPILEPEEWEKNHYEIKNIYNGLRHFRAIASREKEKIFTDQENSHFYLT